MKIVATYDYTLNLGSGPEPVLRGQEIDPPGTGLQSRDERARSLIRQGAALTPEEFAKCKLRADSFHDAARRVVDQANRETAEAAKTRERNAEQARLDREA